MQTPGPFGPMNYIYFTRKNNDIFNNYFPNPIAVRLHANTL